MKAHVVIGNRECGPGARTAVSSAIHWFENYVNDNPYTNAATEARTIMLGLKAVRDRPALDELLALIGEITKSDLGLQEIERAKIRMSERMHVTLLGTCSYKSET